jgi:hypothetical protein
MKINFMTALFAIASIAASAHAYAQSSVRANIPFEFMVSQKVLPAGEYSISNLSDRTIELYNGEKQTRMLVSTTATGYVSEKPHTLVFRKYGDQYFLREVRGGVNEFSLDVWPSKLEKEAQLQAGVNHDKQQSAEIALR